MSRYNTQQNSEDMPRARYKAVLIRLQPPAAHHESGHNPHPSVAGTRTLTDFITREQNVRFLLQNRLRGSTIYCGVS